MQKVVAIMALQITSFVQDEQYMSGSVQEVSTETASPSTTIKGVFGSIDVWRMPRTLQKTNVFDSDIVSCRYQVQACARNNLHQCTYNPLIVHGAHHSKANAIRYNHWN